MKPLLLILLAGCTYPPEKVTCYSHGTMIYQGVTRFTVIRDDGTWHLRTSDGKDIYIKADCVSEVVK